MKVSIVIPEIAALKLAVEMELGTPVKTPRHFSALSFEIEEHNKEYLSDTTLQRIWKYKAGYNTVSIHTLNVLCRYIGYPNWETFCKFLKEQNTSESDMFTGRIIDIKKLTPGTLIRIGWMPDRLCIIRYLGDFKFIAVETKNSKLAAGDIFTCTQMQIGREMCLDNLIHENADVSYVVGTRNGLTTLEILNEE